MGRDKREARPRFLSVRTVRGDPIRIGETTLIPVVRVVSLGRGQGTVGDRSVSGWGVGLARITPVAVLASGPGGERRIAIGDMTASSLRSLGMAAVGVALLGAVVRWLVGRRRR